MDDQHKLIVWARGWFTAQLAKGRTFEDIRHQFNAASPMLVSLFNAMDAADRDETADLCDAIERAFERAVTMADD